MAKFFLAKGADMNARDFDNTTCLHYSVQFCKDPEITRFLVEKGADVNAVNDFLVTPFHLCANYSCNGLPFYLIEKGADYTRITRQNQNALHFSLISGCDTVSAFLMEHGLDINLIDSSGNNPLHMAMMSNRTAMALQLIDRGSDINLKNNENKLSLYFSLLNNNDTLTKALLDREVNLDQEQSEEHYLYMAAEKENTKVVGWLLDKGLKNPMICDKHETCFATAFVYSVSARKAPVDQKAGLFQNSLNIYKVAREKYQGEINKINAQNAAKVAGQCCLAASTGTVVYGVDYNTQRLAYLRNRVANCELKMDLLEKTITCINSAQGHDAIVDCYE